MLVTNNIISKVFSDVNGHLSSKRTIMFLAFIVMIGLAIVSTFYGLKVEQFIFEGFLYIVVGSLFSVASEKFGQGFKQILPENYYTEASVTQKIADKVKPNGENNG